ncbi:uncharacterized protein PG986_010903 [Apiospora aurea]|uniref:Uncharacterized protein n=1 Tax=Apiospora aurea TaxID=335848 RepID=A0ABR1Q3R0_9PEZI
MSSKERFALVTGCGKGGIGEALVKEYACRGLHAIATVLPTESSDHLNEPGITCFKLDLTVEQSILDLKQSIQELTGGRLDVLVNNAILVLPEDQLDAATETTSDTDVSKGYTMTAIDTEIVPVKRMFDVNLFGPMQMVHHFHDMLIRSRGAIVNIGSIGGVVPYLGTASLVEYAASGDVSAETGPPKIISGEIGTNILKNDVHRQLPEGSYYAPLAPEFKKHVQRVPETTNRFEYAANVAAESLKPSPAAWFWYGKTTSIIRFFDTFAWRTFWDWIFWRDFKLAKLKDAHSKRLEGEM